MHPGRVVRRLAYEPLLGVTRNCLHQRMASGAVIKISAIYDEPVLARGRAVRTICRAGQSRDADIDACTDTGVPARVTRKLLP